MDHLRFRQVLFILLCGAIGTLFFKPFSLLIQNALNSELYSHILLVPVISSYLFYLKRKEVFKDNVTSCPLGAVLILAGLTLFFLGIKRGVDLTQNDYLSLTVFSAVLCLWGVFLWIFGAESTRIAAFPLLILLFVVPVPSLLMENIILLLQICSAEVSYWLFKIVGVPIFREGFTFHLPGLSVEVAKSCGGIRSSLVLFIVSIIAGHLFLVSWRGKFILSLFVLPITILKNSIRILTLSLFGAYVDPRILDSVAHRRGGIPFFVVALFMLGVVLFFLRRSESNRVIKEQSM